MDEPKRTLADFKKPRLEMDCSQCPRKGGFRIETLIQKFGANAEIRDVMDSIASAVCDKPRHGEYDYCGAGCPDLIYMWMTSPLRL